jgi:nitrous oxidase accessory protein NosD
MRRQLFSLALALISSGCALTACGGGGAMGGAGDPLSGPRGGGNSPRTGGNGSENVVEIGTQPVEDTPVAQLPPHADHKAVVTTPSAAPKPPPAAPPPLRELFVSPQGDDAATGLNGQPVRTLMRAVALAQPGDLIHVSAGTYAEALDIGPEAQAGTESAKIVLQGEGNPTIVPVASSGYSVVDVRRPHWIVDGFKIDVKGQAKYALAFSGETQGSALMNSELYNGTFGAGVTTYGNAHDVLIENNHIHNFSRGNVDSHGVVVQTTSKNVTVRNNDIHNVSGDSVQCLGPEGFSSLAPADGLLVEANHFYDNRENAVDIKTCYNVTIRSNRMHNFAKATTVAGAVVVVHMSAKNVTVEDNEIYDGGKGIALGGNHDGPMPNNVILRRNKIYGMKKGGTLEGAGIRVENSTNAVIVNNTFTDLQGPALILGYGTGGPTQNLKVLNNVLDASPAVDLGTQAPGLVSDNNLLRSGASFSRNGTAVDFAVWQGSGFDKASKTGSGALVATDALMAALVPQIDAGRTDASVQYCGAAPDVGAFEAGCE